MAVPTHAASCRTRLFPTHCPDCGDPVFYFDCTCGSKVFFDATGDPWPLHADRCIPYLVRQLRDTHRMPHSVIQAKVEEFARLNSVPVPKAVMRQLRIMENRDLGKETVLEVLPHDGEVAFEGTIISINQQVNLLRRERLADNAMSRGIMGPILKDPLIEAVVRGPRDPETGFVSQFTFLCARKTFERQVVRIGSKIGCILVKLRLPSGGTYWKATDVFTRSQPHV